MLPSLYSRQSAELSHLTTARQRLLAALHQTLGEVPPTASEYDELVETIAAAVAEIVAAKTISQPEPSSPLFILCSCGEALSMEMERDTGLCVGCMAAASAQLDDYWNDSNRRSA